MRRIFAYLKDVFEVIRSLIGLLRPDAGDDDLLEDEAAPERGGLIEPEKLLSLATDAYILDYIKDDLAAVGAGNSRTLSALLGSVVCFASNYYGFRLLESSGHSFRDICRMATEVEPKEYPPGVPIDGLSYVIRATVRARDYEHARYIADPIAWQPTRRLSLVGIYGVCYRSGEDALARRILDDLCLAGRVPKREQTDEAQDSDVNRVRDRLWMAVERKLASEFPPGSSFTFSGGPIDPRVTRINVKHKTASIHLGVCRFGEGCEVGGEVKRSIEGRAPGIKTVDIAFSEL